VNRAAAIPVAALTTVLETTIAAAVIEEMMGRAITQVAGAMIAVAAAIPIADLPTMPGRAREPLMEMAVTIVATAASGTILQW
jgi:hypothetical protein